MDTPVKEPHFSCLPSSDSLTSPVGLLPNNPESFSSFSDCGKASKSEDTFIVGEYHLSSCPICLERFTLDNPAIVVGCGHGFHLQCLEDWRQRSPLCPVCSKPLQDEGVPMMSARDTRRRRRYKGGNNNNNNNNTSKGGNSHILYKEQSWACSGMMEQEQRSTSTPVEEYSLTDDTQCSVVRALRFLTRWCSRGAE
ncbi:zinc finger protein [Trypanosoma melophagium]|uniref:zinc finger protein n=1 Tax=Trypanosoma melophagium TaxID=715481 RepID=UPI00351A465F|nr:zinc finger protein [Trypanosoma melophagium]